MGELIQKIKSANCDNDRIAAQAAIDEHIRKFGFNITRKFIYCVELSGMHYQIEVGNAKKYITAEVRNCHRRLNKINSGRVL